MPIRPQRLLAMLLAVVLVLGPAGGAWARDHACAPDERDPAALNDHAAHEPAVADEKVAAGDDEPRNGCVSCQDDCCSATPCSSHACGSGIAALSGAIPAQADYQENLESRAEPRIVLSRRPFPIYRPPRG